MTENGFIGIYRKSAPTKSTVLGPGPPPGRKHKIYRFFTIFTVFGPSIEPEKPSPKSASTANPPSEGVENRQKVKFYQKNHFIEKFIATQLIRHKL
jgi:hypothetical protein